MIEIVEYQTNEAGHPVITLGKRPISQEEIDALFRSLSFLTTFQQVKQMQEICTEEYLDLRRFFMPATLSAQLKKSAHHKAAIQTGNKLLFNYCSAIKLLVEKIERLLKNKDAVALAEFREFCSEKYDQNLSYRFLMRLRNYMTHNRMPLTKSSSSINEGGNLYMDRNELLKWKGWSTVRGDIEQLDPEIPVQPFLRNIRPIMNAVYLQGLYHLVALDTIEGLKDIEGFAKRHHVESFGFVTYDRDENGMAVNVTVHPIPWGDLAECVGDLNCHPSVSIRTTEHAGEALRMPEGGPSAGQA